MSRLPVSLAVLAACLILVLAAGPRAFALDADPARDSSRLDACAAKAGGAGLVPSCRAPRPRLELAQNDYYRQRFEDCMAQHFGAGRRESETDFCAEWAPCPECRPAPPPKRRGPCGDIRYYPEDGIFYPVPHTGVYMAQNVRTGSRPWEVVQKRREVIDWFRKNLSGWAYFESGPDNPIHSWWFERQSDGQMCKIEVQDTYPVSIVYGPYPPDMLPQYGNPIPH